MSRFSSVLPLVTPFGRFRNCPKKLRTDGRTDVRTNTHRFLKPLYTIGPDGQKRGLESTVKLQGTKFLRASKAPTPRYPITLTVWRSVPSQVPVASRIRPDPPPTLFLGDTGRHPKFNSAFHPGKGKIGRSLFIPALPCQVEGSRYFSRASSVLFCTKDCQN